MSVIGGLTVGATLGPLLIGGLIFSGIGVASYGIYCLLKEKIKINEEKSQFHNDGEKLKQFSFGIAQKIIY